MALYAIGDVQGCYEELQSLLARIGHDPARDRLWFTGDLVNRGPDSLGVLRFVRALGDAAVTVLGNHDLHLLAVAAGVAPRKARDSFDDVLEAPDREGLLDWLRARSLLHVDRDAGYALLHAGLLPQWGLDQAQALAGEVERALRAANYPTLLRDMYGDEPRCWAEGLRGAARLRAIVNALTRLRYCTREGAMALEHKGPPGSQPSPYEPWFHWRAGRAAEPRIVFGHWSTLGRYQDDRVLALDTGCLWGQALTAARLDTATPQFQSVPCAQRQAPRGAW